MKRISKFLQIFTILAAITAHADTPAPGTVKAKTYSGDGNTAVTVESNGSMDVNVTSSLEATVESSLGSPLFTQTVFGAAVIDPRTRQWSLLNTTDSVTAFQGGSPWNISLPPLASTSTLQTAGNTTLSSILSALGGTLTTSVSNFPLTQPVSVSSLPLPANAAVENGGHLASIDSKITTSTNGIKVDTSGVVQPVSGTINVGNFPAAQNVNVRDGTGTSIGSTSGALNVAITNGAITNPSVSTTGSAVPSNATYMGARDGSSNLRGLMVDSSGFLQVNGSGVTQPVSGTLAVSNFPTTQPVSAASLPLPANAAKESGGNLDTIASKTSSIDSKIKSGQQLMANSVGVVVASDQSAIPVSGTLAVSNFPSTQTVAGTVTSLQGGAPWTASIVQGGNTASVSSASALKVDGSAVTQPVSAASLPLPANAAVESGGHLASLDTKVKTNQQTMANSISMVIASDQTAIPVSGSISATNASIGTNGSTAPTSSTQVGGQDGSGNLQPAMVTSGNLHVDGSAVIQPISASALPLPANAAKETGGNLATAATDLGSILGNQTNGSQKSQQVDASGNVQPAGDTNAHGVHVQPGDGTNAQAYTGVGEAKVLVTPLTSASTVTAVQTTGSNLHTQIDSGTVTANVGTTGGLALDATVSSVHAAPGATAPSVSDSVGGTDTNGKMQTLAVSTAGKVLLEGGNATAVKVDGSAVIQPVSGTINVGNFPATQTIAGTVTANAGTGTFTVGQATGSNLHTVVDSGSITANIGTTNGLALDSTVSNVQGSAAGGTAASKASLGGLLYNSTPPTLTNGQQAALQGNSSGALKVDGSAVTQPVSGTITANAGTGNFSVVQSSGSNLHTNVDVLPSLPVGGNTIGAVNQAGVPWAFNLTQLTGSAPSVTNWLPSRISNGSVYVDPTQIRALTSGSDSVSSAESGTWTVQPGNTANTTPWLFTVNQGGNSATVTAANALKVDGSAVTQPISAASLPLPTGAATSANQTNGSQESKIVDGSGNVIGPTTTISGTNYFPVIQASSATPGSAVPARATLVAGSDGTNAQTISTNTSGQVNINNVSGTVSLPTGAATAANQTSIIGSAAGGTAAANSMLVGGTVVSQTSFPSYSSGTQAGFELDSSGRVIFSSDNAVSGTITTTCSTPTGSCPAGSFVQIDPLGFGSAQFQLSGTFTGATCGVYGTVDGSTWVQILTGSGSTGLYSTASITTTGKFRVFRISALEDVRLACTALSTGSISVVANAANPTDIPEVVQLTAGNLQTQINGNNSGSSVQLTADSNGNLNVVGSIASGSSDSGNPVKIGGIYETSQTSVSTGQRSNAHVTAFGDLTTGDNSKYSHINTATTTTVKSGAGLLYAICFNTLINNETVTVYDNTAGSGTEVALWTEAFGGGSTFPNGCQRYNGTPFSTGLTVVTSSTSDITVLYK